MQDAQAERFYCMTLAPANDPAVEHAVISMVDEAAKTRGHFTMQEALAVLIVNRRVRGILSLDEATRVFARLVK
jgi:hypothetical protein